MIVLNYKSKKELKENVGKELDYTETSIFGQEYLSNGSFCGCNRPSSTEYPKFHLRKGREFFAKVTMKDDLILKVSWFIVLLKA